jgi:hypothetical protein
MPVLQMELTKLEAEILEAVEVSRPKQNKNLETLMSSKGEGDSVGVLMLSDQSPSYDFPCRGGCTGYCCCF